MVMAANACDRLEKENLQYSTALQSSFEIFNTNESQKLFQFLCNSSFPRFNTEFLWKTLIRYFSIPLQTYEVDTCSKKTENLSNEASNTKQRSKIDPLPQQVIAFIRFVTGLLYCSSNDSDQLTSAGLPRFGVDFLQWTLNKNDEALIFKFVCQVITRFLLYIDDIKNQLNDNHSYVDMTSSPKSIHLKPGRVAPPIPKHARPLPPPPVPGHSVAGIIPILMSSPPVPVRSKSLSRRYFEAGDDFRLSDSNIFVCTSEEDSSEEESLVNNRVINTAISHVVRNRLFNSQIPPVDTFVHRAIAPSMCNHNNVTVLKKFLSRENHLVDENVAPSPASVTTPDSGCGTAEDDSSQIPSSVEHSEVFIPKLNLEEAIQENELFNVSELVPPLDLSEISPQEEPTHHSNSFKKLPSVHLTRSKRKSRSQSSPHKDATSPNISSPIDIPPLKLSSVQDTDDTSNEASPPDGSLRWRDAWSTDEETLPMFSCLENVNRRDVRYPIQEKELEMAPSSPESHIPRIHAFQHSHHHNHHHNHHHHHHHHKRHSHHDNHLSRPKFSNGLRRETVESYDHIVSSLQDMLASLEINRKENGRPEDLTLMTRKEIRCEKLAMQRELLKHEGQHGRPSSKEEKEIMRGVYERYRMVKRLLADTLSPPFNCALRRMDHFDDDIDPIQQGDDVIVSQVIPLSPPNERKKSKEFRIEANDHVSADLSLSELRKQLKEAKAKRKRLRRKLHEFEKEIEQQYGRAVNYNDRILMADEYNECHGLKLKVRLLNALIEKRDSQYQYSPQF